MVSKAKFLHQDLNSRGVGSGFETKSLLWKGYGYFLEQHNQFYKVFLAFCMHVKVVVQGTRRAITNIYALHVFSPGYFFIGIVRCIKN